MNRLWAGGVLILLVVITVLLILLWRCCERAQAPQVVVRDPAVELAAEGGECPHDPGVSVPLSEGSDTITAIPEYHDCQRFIVKDGNGERYDSLYAIFASFTLPKLTDSIAAYNQTPSSTVAIPAATVVSYGGDYARLHIKDGFSCLYLWRHKTDVNKWRAWMVNLAPSVHKCPNTRPVGQPDGGRELIVFVRVVPGYSDEDYPPVTRWEWDANEDEHYIGIKCGAAWCEVSDDSTTSEAPNVGRAAFTDPPGLPSTAVKTERVQAVKGWYDAQRLAVRQGGKTIPSDVWAVVVPHPRLADMSMGDTFNNSWTHVATILASDDYEGAVLTLRHGRQNRLFLCYGSADGCDLPNEQLCVTDRGTVRWWGMSEHGAGRAAIREYRCVENVQHPPPPHVPGTARWRWLAYDETTWTRCDEGCCKLQ